MKAHRRNGIPTLMLQDGGSSVIRNSLSAISKFLRPPEQAAERERLRRQRMGLNSILAARPRPFDTTIDRQSRDTITEAIAPFQLALRRGPTAISPTDYAKSLADSYVRLGEYISGSQGTPTDDRRTTGPQFAANLRERIGAEINRVNPVEPVSDSMYEFSVQDALLRSAQDSAATPVGVAPEGLEAEALRQATGALTKAEEAAATARRLLLKLRRLLLKLRRLLLRLLPLKAQKKRPFVRRRVRRPKPKKLLRLPRLPLELPLSSPSLSNQMIVLRVH
jgi:hypothetical protein